MLFFINMHTFVLWQHENTSHHIWFELMVADVFCRKRWKSVWFIAGTSKYFADWERALRSKWVRKNATLRNNKSPFSFPPNLQFSVTFSQEHFSKSNWRERIYFSLAQVETNKTEKGLRHLLSREAFFPQRNIGRFSAPINERAKCIFGMRGNHHKVDTSSNKTFFGPRHINWAANFACGKTSLLRYFQS